MIRAGISRTEENPVRFRVCATMVATVITNVSAGEFRRDLFVPVGRQSIAGM